MDDYTAKAKVMVKVLDFVKSGGAIGVNPDRRWACRTTTPPPAPSPRSVRRASGYRGGSRLGDFFRLIVEHGPGQGLRHFLPHNEHRRASWGVGGASLVDDDAPVHGPDRRHGEAQKPARLELTSMSTRSESCSSKLIRSTRKSLTLAAIWDSSRPRVIGRAAYSFSQSRNWTAWQD